MNLLTANGTGTLSPPSRSGIQLPMFSSRSDVTAAMASKKPPWSCGWAACRQGLTPSETEGKDTEASHRDSS